MEKNTSPTKTIVLGITGGIAAYKACDIVRLLRKQGCDTWVMMSDGAQNFITPLTLQTLSGHPVFTNLFDLTQESVTQESKIGHILLADTANVILIAPATANIIAKAAHGLADDLISTVLLATKSPIVMAPSMNVNMYENPITQENLHTLKKRGVHIIDPTEGDLACGWQGMGRLADPQVIVDYALKLPTPRERQ